MKRMSKGRTNKDIVLRYAKTNIIRQRYLRNLKNEHCKILSELKYYKNEEQE